MRKIKFRAWDGRQYHRVCRLGLRGFSTHLWSRSPTSCASRPTRTLVVEQYTGLKDRDGKGIYEGDIVEWRGDKFKIIIYCATAWVQSETLIGKWPFSMALTNTEKQLPLYEIDNTEIKVVGNIHENPKLSP